MFHVSFLCFIVHKDIESSKPVVCEYEIMVQVSKLITFIYVAYQYQLICNEMMLKLSFLIDVKQKKVDNKS